MLGGKITGLARKYFWPKKTSCSELVKVLNETILASLHAKQKQFA